MIPVQSLCARLGTARILPVVSLEDPQDGVPLVQALRKAGISAIELALRTPRALEALVRIREVAPDLLVGAGTVLSPSQAEAAKAAGAGFALAPGYDAATARHCQSIGLPFVPGVATATEIQAAVAAGCLLLKFFPAGPLGGPQGLRALAAPFNHLGVRFLPLGGICEREVASYLAEPFVLAVGGSWIAPRQAIDAADWVGIQTRAEEALRLAGNGAGVPY